MIWRDFASRWLVNKNTKSPNASCHVMYPLANPGLSFFHKRDTHQPATEQRV